MNSIKQNMKNNWDIVIFILIMFIKVISVNITLKLSGLSQYTIIGTLGSILVLVGIACLFKRRARILVLIILNLIVTVLIYVDNVYNRYFLDVTTIGLVKQMGLAGEVGDSIFALLSVFDILFFVDIIILLLFFIKNRKKIKVVKTKFLKRLVESVGIIIVGILLCVFSVNGLQKVQVGILKAFYDKKAIVREVGLLNYHILDINNYLKNYVFKNNSITEAEKKEVEMFFDNKSKGIKENPKYFGATKGRNLIVVQLEAFQSFVLNKEINGVEITPNLNKLAKESLNLNNYYFQTSIGGTSDAEFLTNNSFLPAKEGAIYYQYSGNTFTSLPKALKKENYFTSVMHANRPGFWNRQEMYKSLGFDAYEHEKNYNIDDVKILGLSDKSFFKQNIGKIKEYKEPFYSFMISLTSHYSFRDKDNSLKDVMNVGDFEGYLIGDFMKTAKYTDEAIGEFIENLKKEGLYENSVIVFYGDHSAVSSDKRDQLAKAAYGKDTITDLEWQEAQKVVGMIHIPNSDIKGEINIAAGQYDMYPTLLNLFGLNSKYVLGQDILNSEDGFVVTRSGNFFTDKLIYVKSEDKIYDRETKKELNKNDYKEYFDKMNEYFTMSDRVVENNLLEEFTKK